MPSHAGRWNHKRIYSVKELLDDHNEIIFAPVYKQDHANITIFGIDGDSINTNSMIQIARTAVVINKQSPNTVNHEEDGVFSLSSYDEDMFYGMSAILSALGYSVYLPKLVKIKPEKKKWFPVLNGVHFKEFQPHSSFADEKIVSIKMTHVTNFRVSKFQPEFAF